MSRQKIEKWRNWIAHIRFELEGMLTIQYYFNEFDKMIDENPNLSEYHPFLEWIRGNYVVNASLYIFRFIDTHKKSISLLKLLCEIKESPELLSKDRFVSINKELSIPEAESDVL